MLITNMEKQLAIARALTDLLENRFGIGKFRFGLDPIIGAIPILGDLITTGLSLYIVWIGMKIKIPNTKIFQMLGNIVIDYFIGLFPVIGDITDIAFKSNSKNIKILEEYASIVVEGKLVE